MKLSSVSAVLALATATYAIPADQIEKRDVCTFFGYFTYSCAGSAGPTATAVPTTTAPATTPATTTAPATTAASKTTASSGSSSTGGASKYNGGDTAKDVTDDNGCTPLTVIYARGTSESGNIGSVAGPPMFEQLIKDLGAKGVSLQGVPYPASAAGNADCGSDGGSDMAKLVKKALHQCPHTKIALSGYSQGACVVHNAVEQQGLAASKIGAVVLFGDPFNGESVGSVPSSKVLEICAKGDDVCNGSGTFAITQAHLSYGNDAGQAASFVEKTTGV